MTRKEVSLYMVATCSMVIVSPGRLVCGIVLALELCLLMVAGSFFRCLLTKLNVKQLRSTCMCTFIVTITIIVRSLMIMVTPELALQLGFVIFLPAISTFSTVFLFDDNQLSLRDEIRLNAGPAVIFSSYIIITSLVRDVFGYGTITLPSYGYIHEILILDASKISSFTFLATIPGALILSAFILSLYLLVERNLKIIDKAGLDK